MGKNAKIIRLKCLQMAFAELESVRNLTVRVYDNLIADEAGGDGAEGYQQEKKLYLGILDDIIEERVVKFLDCE